MLTTITHLRSAQVVSIFLVLFAFPVFAHAQCGGTTGFTGWGGPTHINVDEFGVSYGGFAGAGEWNPMTADMQYNTVDFLDPDNVFATLLQPFLLPVAYAQCGGNPSVTPAVSLVATPGIIDAGESSTLTWGSNNVSTCIGDAFATGGATSGTASVSPTETTTYTVSCYVSGTNQNYTWQLHSTDTSDFACPLTDMTRGGYNHLEDCPVADPSGMSCTAGTQNCKTKVATAACTMETAVYSCEPPSPADVTDTATVTVRPTGSCSASPTSVEVGESVLWTAVASGGNGTYTYSWSGTDSLSGTNATVSKTYTTTGTKTASVTITSDSQSSGPIPCTVGGDGVTVSDSGVTATLTASPTQVPVNTTSTLTWECAGGATSASISGVGTVSPASGGSVLTPSLTQTSNNFELTCTSPSDTDTDIAVVTTKNPTGTITADPERVLKGTESTLDWACYPEAVTFSVSGTNGFSAGTATGTDVPSHVINTQTTFTLFCDSVAVDTAIVNIEVNVDEF